jgi:hypothetical protein
MHGVLTSNWTRTLTTQVNDTLLGTHKFVKNVDIGWGVTRGGRLARLKVSCDAASVGVGGPVYRHASCSILRAGLLGVNVQCYPAYH